MPEITIFYSWQSDTPKEANQYFIRHAIKQAAESITKDHGLEEAIRVEHDTSGRPGTPAITDTIFERIESCSVFIADLTFVATTGGNSPKSIPNPNVLLELGYAAATVGWERIICVSNEAFGSPGRHVFNLAHRRWPIRYTLTGDESVEKQKQVRRDLASAIAQAIRAVMHDDGWLAHVRAKWNEQGMLVGASNKSITIATRKPEFWRFRLLCSLLEDRLAPLLKVLDDLRRGNMFLKRESMSLVNYAQWMESRPTLLLDANEYFQKRFFGEWIEALQDEETTVERMDKALTEMVEACGHFLDWEVKQRSVIPPKEMAEAHKYTCEWGGGIVLDVADWHKSLENVLEAAESGTASGHHEIILKFNEPRGLREWERELARAHRALGIPI
jgi:hypothetical protein